MACATSTTASILSNSSLTCTSSCSIVDVIAYLLKTLPIMPQNPEDTLRMTHDPCVTAAGPLPVRGLPAHPAAMEAGVVGRSVQFRRRPRHRIEVVRVLRGGDVTTCGRGVLRGDCP